MNPGSCLGGIWWVQPQKTGKTVNWGWWRWVVVVVVFVVAVLVLVLNEHLHKSILLLDQLRELRRKVEFGVTSWRHLMGLEWMRSQKRIRPRE